MSLPKNQHWVPRFYLRHFATPETYLLDDPQVWILSKNKEDGEETLVNIKNICAKRFLYTPEASDGTRSWELESKLGQLESLLSDIWKELANEFLDLGDLDIRKALSLFIAVMYLRHPSQIDTAKRIHKNCVDAFDNLPKRNDGTPDIVGLEINGKMFDIDVGGWEAYKAWSDSDHHKFFVNMIEREAALIANTLMKKRWSIVFTENDQFITTDKPVAMENQTKSVFGFGTPGTIVSFPISQRRILVMDDMHNEPPNQYYPLKKGALGAFNCGIWRNGSRFMISGRSIPEVLYEIVSWGDAYLSRI